MPDRKSQGQDYRFGFNGQEKSNEIKGENNSYSALFWEYDPRYGRRMNTDPKPNMSISPYAALANNPNWFKDLKGDTLEVGGDVTFRSNTQRNLLAISQTEIGKKILERLQSSKQIYKIEQVWLLTNSKYDPNEKTLFYDDNPWRKSLDGGAINGLLALAHELWHVYQDDALETSLMTRQKLELDATVFQNYLISVFGFGNLRTRYKGLFNNLPNEESAYNPKNEKITNLRIFSNLPPYEKKVMSDGHSDFTTLTRIYILQDKGYTVTYEKSMDVNGKEIRQSVQKSNEQKIAKEEQQ